MYVTTSPLELYVDIWLDIACFRLITFLIATFETICMFRFLLTLSKKVSPPIKNMRSMHSIIFLSIIGSDRSMTTVSGFLRVVFPTTDRGNDPKIL